MKKTINLSFARSLILLLGGLLFLSIGTLKAQGPCNPLFTFVVGSGSANKTVSFNSANKDTLVQHMWFFGDGTTSASMNPTRTYTNFGTYTICHRVTKGSICVDTFCTTVTLTSSTPCIASYTYYKDTLKGDTIYFNNTSTGSSLTYFWSFGDSTTSTIANPTKVFTKSGSYYVCLTVRSLIDSTCFNTKCSTIVKGSNNLPCVANFTYFKDSLKGDTIYFNNTSTGSNLAYYWNFGNGTTSTLKNPTKVFTQNGSYNVCLTVRNLLDTTCINTRCSTIVKGNSNLPCVANFTYFRDSLKGDTIYFNNISTGNNLTYYWNFGNGTTSTLKNPKKVFTQNGTYTVCLTVRNLLDSTCINTRCSTIVKGNSNLPCVANFTYSLNPVKVNINDYPCLFNATSSTGNNLIYSWNFGDGWTATSATYLHLFKPGTYNVCLTVRNALDSTCISTKCVIITVKADTIKPCDADFGFFRDTLNSSHIFYPTNPHDSGTTYLWSFGDGTSSAQANPNHSFPSSGFYFVCLTVSNLRDSCSSTHCDTVVITNPGTSVKNVEAITLNAVYPIPAKNEINIDMNCLFDQQINLTILDMTGKICINKIYKTAIGQNNIKLDITDLFEGVYLIQINTPQGKIIHKMIK